MQSCYTAFRNLGGRVAFEGVITTVKVFEDNVLVKSALTEKGSGRVLVVDGAGSLCAALFGDEMGNLAAVNGWEGLNINGEVRDVAALSRIDLGVKALGSNLRKSTKQNVGQRDTSVTFGGVTFRPLQPPLQRHRRHLDHSRLIAQMVASHHAKREEFE